MIVTVVAMGMMEAAVDDVINMIPVRHGFVASFPSCYTDLVKPCERQS